MEATLTSTRDQSGIKSKWQRNYPEQTTEQEQERSLKTSDGQKNQLQHNLISPAQDNRRCGWQSDPQITSWRERPKKRNPTTIKNQRHTENQHMTAQDQ